MRCLMLTSLMPTEILLVVALIGVVFVLLALNIFADLLQESSRWEQVRGRLRRRQRALENESMQSVSGEVIDATMP